MGATEWTTLGAVAALVLGFGGVLVRALDRVNKAQSTASAAKTVADEAVKHADELEKQLTDHRVAVAKEYVSNDALARLEKGIMDAINRLGDRLDALINKATH